MSLSPAATIVLTRAAERPDRRLEFHRKLPTAARHKMIDALLRDGLIAETRGDYRLGDGAVLFENSATGLMLTTLALTDAGFHVLKLDPPGSAPVASVGATGAPTEACDVAVAQEAMAVANALEAAQAAPTVPPRASLRDSAAAVLKEWDDRDDQQQGLADAIERMRAALVASPGRVTRRLDSPRKPREGTKQQAVLDLLRRDEGANIAQIVAATAWTQHTVRGFLANLKKKGITVEVLERVRQASPGGAGAKGSFSIYRITNAG